MPSLVTSYPCSESRWGGEGGGREAGPPERPKKPRRAGSGRRAAVTGRGSAGQNSTKGSGQFSYEQGLQQAVWESPQCCAVWASASEPPAREALGGDPARSPAPVLLLMGGLRPTRAAGPAGGGERGPGLSPQKALATGLCAGVCFVFPNYLAFR